MQTEKSHDLFDFMAQVSSEISSEYERIQKRATEDPGTAGDQGEENWAQLLRDWLPSSYHIVTKGRIISHLGEASPQVDVLVLRPSYPQKLLGKKLYLAAGVAAAFECKTTLKSRHIADAAATCSKIKKLYPNRSGTPYVELRSPIVYGLLAHSHSWTQTPESTIEDKLIAASAQSAAHPRLQLDLLCVADLGTWHASSLAYLPPMPGAGGNCASTVFVGNTFNNAQQIKGFSPVGTLVSSLTQKLAWEDPSIRAIADYYRLTNLGGAGSGLNHPWPLSIYSDAVRSGIFQGRVTSGQPWSEWDMFVM